MQGTVNFTVTDFTGAVNLSIDTNSNGSYTDTVDRVITTSVTPGANTVVFDGLDGTGVAIPQTQEISMRLSINRVGETHFLNRDVENRSGGIEVAMTNTAYAGAQLVYWDDSTLNTNRCSTTSPLSSTSGSLSTGGVHSWINNLADNSICPSSPSDMTQGSWGNGRSIEEWVYTPVNITATVATPAPAIDTVKTLVDQKTISKTVYDITYGVKVKNTGNVVNPNVQLTENLSRTFSDGAPSLAITTPVAIVNGPCTANTAFNGTTNTSLLTGTDTHAVNDSCELTFTVRVTYADATDVPADPQLNQVYASTATGTNTGFSYVGGSMVAPTNVIVSDLSTDSTDLPTTTGGDTSSLTPVSLPNNAIDVIKSVGDVKTVNDTTFNVPYTVQVKNTGTAPNYNVQVNDYLVNTFSDGSPVITIAKAPEITNGDCTANRDYNGTDDTALLAGTDTQLVGESCTIYFIAQINYDNADAIPTDAQNNYAYASTTASGPNGGYTFPNGNPTPPVNAIAVDISTDGTDFPDAANGDTASPTPVVLPIPEEDLAETGTNTTVIVFAALALIAASASTLYIRKCAQI